VVRPVITTRFKAHEPQFVWPCCTSDVIANTDYGYSFCEWCRCSGVGRREAEETHYLHPLTPSGLGRKGKLSITSFALVMVDDD
jgi:hypothetical protein